MAKIYYTLDTLRKMSRKELEKLIDDLTTIKEKSKDPKVKEKCDEQMVWIWLEMERRLK